MTMRTGIQMAALAAGLVAASGAAHAEFQNHTGDSCRPENDSMVYQLDSGAIINATGTTKSVMCPLMHQSGPSYWSNATAMTLQLGFRLAYGGTISCAIISAEVMQNHWFWGTPKTFTGGTGASGTLTWSPSEFPTGNNANLAQFTVACGLPNGGRVNGYYTSK